MADKDIGFIQRGLEGLGSLFSRSPEVVPGDMTPEAVRILQSKGIVDPRVYDPKLQFIGKRADPGDFNKAYVQPKDPSAVYLNKQGWGVDALENPMDSHTLAHEVSHSQAYSGGAELTDARGRNNVLRDNYAQLAGLDKAKYSDIQKATVGALRTNLSDPKMQQYFKKVYGIDSSYMGDSVPYGTNAYEEIASDLSSAMVNSKKNIFADPYLIKNLFNNDPHLMEAVRSTLNTEPRMDARDPQRFSVSPGNVEKYKALIASGEVKASAPVPVDEKYFKGGRVRLI